MSPTRPYECTVYSRTTRKKLSSCLSFGQAALTFWVPGATSCLSYSTRADLGVGPGGPGLSFVVLLNILTALHVQYGIQRFAKFKHPECT